MYYKIAEIIGIFRLRIILIVPFVLLTFGAVGLVGFLSFINGQKAVNDVASQLREEISDRIQLYLDTYLATPHLINRINIDAVRSGQLDLQNLPKLERYLISQLQQFESVSGILYSSNRGKFLASYRYTENNTFLVSDQLDTSKISSYSLNSPGDRDKLYKVFRQPDARQRPWYKAAAIARKPTWTQVFLLGDKSGFSLNASQPIYGKDNKELLGVFSVGLNLRRINTFLNSLRIGKSGKIFIIERNGLVVATSTPEIPYVITPKNELKRFKATEISNPLISATGRFLNNYFNGDLNKLKNSEKLDFKIDGQRQFVQVMPYQEQLGLDWLIVEVVPESDFMAQVDFNTYTTISLCLVTLIIATGIGIYTAHWITKPILTLNTAAKDLAKGKWHKTCEINRSDELGELAKSFNFMAAQLQAS
ncbi:MAG: cache domain-containing protein, partial [Coleofasciculaceae cyanobacterium]